MASELPEVPKVGDLRMPSLDANDDAPKASSRRPMNEEKRAKPITVHFTEADRESITLCAGRAGEEPAPFSRQAFVAQLRQLYR